MFLVNYWWVGLEEIKEKLDNIFVTDYKKKLFMLELNLFMAVLVISLWFTAPFFS